MKVSEIASAVGGRVVGDGGLEVRRVASLAAAGPDDLSFVEDVRWSAAGEASAAGALIVAENAAAGLASRTMVAASNPRLAFAQAGALLLRAARPAATVHPSAVVDPTAVLAKDVSVGAHAYVGPGVRVGPGTVIGPGSLLLGEVEIGADCTLVARVTVYPRTRIGARAVVHAGVVLGSDGFGFVPDRGGRYHKFPQIGGLVIGDDVEIGANTAIDGGALDPTVIDDGVKLDNLVHIAHNVRLGENVVIAAQSAVSGSTTLGRNVMVGGTAAIGDHVIIEDGVIIGGAAGVASNKVLRGKGAVFWGTPARPLQDHLRELATLARLAKKKRSQDPD
jgi:UDP-3-O-[3-hydroxymyristoyl] glucosamine N-acyltransferase